MGHECAGAAAMVDFALALHAACFLCASAVLRQCAKKVESDSPGLVDFGIVIFVLNLPDGGNSNYRRIVINPADQKGFGG